MRYSHNRCRYAEVGTIIAAIVAALFFGGVMQTSNVRSQILTQTIGLDLTVVSSKLDIKCGCFQSTFRHRRLQPSPGGKPLQPHLHIERPFLQRVGTLRPIHASASEVVELSDRGRCDNVASLERVFVTYVIQLGVSHVLPLRLPTPRRFYVPPMFYLAYFPIVATMTAKLEMNPVNAMNLESSYDQATCSSLRSFSKQMLMPQLIERLSIEGDRGRCSRRPRRNRRR
jgi:hypothetical protein